MPIKIKDDYFDKEYNEFEKELENAIKKEIELGKSLTLEFFREQGKKTTTNPTNLTKKDIELYKEKLFLNMKDVNRELSKNITNKVIDNISKGGSDKDLAKELKKMFDKDSVEHFNYKNRFETIARNESGEILNQSADKQAKKLNAKKKYVSTVLDSRTCPICLNSESKYGSEDKAIDIDKNFTVTHKGKVYSSETGKLHISCRCLTIYIF